MRPPRPQPCIHRPLGHAMPETLVAPPPALSPVYPMHQHLVSWEARRRPGGWDLQLTGHSAARRLLGSEESEIEALWFRAREGGIVALEATLDRLEASRISVELLECRWQQEGSEPRWLTEEFQAVEGGFCVLSWDATAQYRSAERCQHLEHRLERVLESTDGVLWLSDSSQGMVTLHPATLEAAEAQISLGAHTPDGYAQAWQSAIHADDAARVAQWRQETCDAGRGQLRQSYRLVDRHGAVHWVQEDLFVDTRGRLCALVFDITERRRTEEVLRHALVSSRCMVWQADVTLCEGEWLWLLHMSVPDVALECFQVSQSAGESYARSWERAIDPADQEAIRTARDNAIRSGSSSFQVSYRIKDRRGIVRQLQEEVRLLRTGTESFSAIGVVTDQSVQQKALSELRASREEYRALFEHVPIGIYRLSAERQFAMANPALMLMLGFDAGEDPQVLEQCLAELDRTPFFEQLKRDGAVRGWESAWKRKDGSGVVVRENVKAVYHPDGVLQCFEGTVEDITERRRAAERIEWQATHDTLTGLPNRTYFLEALQAALSAARENNRQLGVFFVDLDKFKQINDLLGHGVGDRLLPIIAQRLQSVVRSSDMVARMGGDEFTLLLPELKDTLVARRLAINLRNAIAEPIELDGRKFEIAASIGAVLYPRDGDDAETLLRHADIAMYRAKAQGGNEISFFAASMHEEMRERVTLEADLRRAIAGDELVLHYQPQVSIGSQRVVGVEALVRWNHPERGLLPPAQFIPLAEETGLIISLGEWVLKEACKQGAQWLAAGVPLRMSVNMSPKQLLDPSYPKRIGETLRDTLFDPRLLEIELTESAILESGSRVESAMKEIKEHGVGLQIDDFGTGYSSLALLRRYPMDVLKIDRGFIGGLGTTPEDAAIVRSVIELAHTLGMMVIAEGVETPSQLQALEELGCDIVQGYLAGGPVPADALLASIAQIGGIAIPSRRAA